VSECFSLYIHIPFCAALCDYCDFYSITAGNNGFIDRFLDAVIADIHFQAEFFNIEKIPTVYIGGGTPSVLGKRIRVLLDALNEKLKLTPIEFTVEANPESLTEEFLDACREGGVNRLSLGVQTFHEPSRNAVNRMGNARLLEERLDLASRFFPDALSADLITGLPYQSERNVLDDISRLLDFDVVHVSLYSLSVENDTPLKKKIKDGIVILPGNDEADVLWLAGRDALEKAGFRQYEVSNFALDGKSCLHNIRYWRMAGWLGAGPAASGTVINEKTGTAKRFTFASDVNAYVNAPFVNTAICEELDRDVLLRESLLMGYRYCEGPDKQLFKKRFGSGIEECIGETLLRWKNRNIMLFLNKFLSEAFLELDSGNF
jgi:oxygen-independent coproporphyrinogen-3 oxidase